MLIDNFVKLNRPSRNAIWAALTVITLIAAYNQIVTPNTVYLAAAQRYESVMDNVSKKNRIITEAVNNKKKKLDELHKQFADVQSVLFSPEKAKEFFSDLQPVSEVTGCAVYSLNIAADAAEPKDKQGKDVSGITAHSAMLSVIGPYDNIIRLLDKLQTRSEKVWINSLKMEGLGNDSPQLKCDLTITIYTIQDKEVKLHE